MKSRRYGGLGIKRGVNRNLVDRREGKRPIGRPRRRWKDDIKRGLGEVGCKESNYRDLALDRVVYG